MRRERPGGPDLIPVNIVRRLHFGQRGGSITASWGSNDICDWGMMLPSNGREHDTLSHRYLPMAKTMMHRSCAVDCNSMVNIAHIWPFMKRPQRGVTCLRRRMAS